MKGKSPLLAQISSINGPLKESMTAKITKLERTILNTTKPLDIYIYRCGVQGTVTQKKQQMISQQLDHNTTNTYYTKIFHLLGVNSPT